ncbi:MAG TPA: ester cyclase [Candidatus Acidoferrales bacterium]|nr:ester cyclase [Candidatus Acidoferrales bacterium]
MSEANKAIVRRLFDEVWNCGSVDKIEELYSPDFAADYRPYAPLRRGHDAIRDMVQRAWATFPDYHEELLDMVAEGDKVAVRLRITGTQKGQWGPIPPTGTKLDFEEMLILRIADGKVVEQRGLVDNLNALRQLGLVPTPT